MKLCTNCGKEIPENVKFCPECGASLEQKAVGDTPLEEGAMVGGIQVRAGEEALPPETSPKPPVEQVPGASRTAAPKEQPTPASGRTSNPGVFSLSFSGRARRSDWWVMTLIAGLGVGVMFAICLVSIGINVFQEDFDGNAAALSPGAGLALVCIGVPLLIWYLATGVRRCHDLGWSGWVILLYVLAAWFLPYGWVLPLVVFGGKDGQPFPNQYGPDPKGRNQPRTSK